MLSRPPLARAAPLLPLLLSLLLGADPAAGSGAAPPDGEVLATAFNDRVLQTEVHDRAFSFLVGGHLYGDPRKEKSVFPSATLLANIERINASGASFFVGLGDLFMRCWNSHIDAFLNTFGRKLDMPFLNAPGNHCTENRKLYERRFGTPTWSSFVHGHVLFVVLDSELDVGRIGGEQLEFLLDRLELARTEKDVRSVAIFSHKLIWLDDRPLFRIVYDHVNNKAGYQTDGAFVRDVMPALLSVAAESKPIAWFSGDVGVRWSRPIFYHHETAVDLTWLATGMGDTAEDVLVQVHVAPSGKMSFEVLRMDGQPAQPVESYGLPYWHEAFDE